MANNGDVFPSGFLPLPTGNVRTDDIVTLYREHPVFTGLRDSSQFKGRCGALRVRPDLRRLAGPGVRLDGRPARGRSALPVRPAGRGRHGTRRGAARRGPA